MRSSQRKVNPRGRLADSPGVRYIVPLRGETRVGGKANHGWRQDAAATVAAPANLEIGVPGLGETGERGGGIPDSRWQPRPKGQVSGYLCQSSGYTEEGSSQVRGTFPV